MKKERYFIICFSFFRERSWGLGSCNLTTDGCYPNLEKTVKQVTKKFNYEKISITNIIELSKKDYLDGQEKLMKMKPPKIEVGKYITMNIGEYYHKKCYVESIIHHPKYLDDPDARLIVIRFWNPHEKDYNWKVYSFWALCIFNKWESSFLDKILKNDKTNRK